MASQQQQFLPVHSADAEEGEVLEQRVTSQRPWASLAAVGLLLLAAALALAASLLPGRVSSDHFMGDTVGLNAKAEFQNAVDAANYPHEVKMDTTKIAEFLPSYDDNDWDDWVDGANDSDPNDDGDWDAEEDDDEMDDKEWGWEDEDDDDMWEADDGHDGDRAHDDVDNNGDHDVGNNIDHDEDNNGDHDEDNSGGYSGSGSRRMSAASSGMVDVVLASAKTSRGELRSKLAPGCYMKQQAAGNPAWKCPKSKMWVQDVWGKVNRKSFESKAKCLERKQGHDSHCGSKGSRWRYVPARRGAQKKINLPAQPGCYYRVPGGAPRCSTIHEWTVDAWGRDNAKSFSSKHACDARKHGHDAYCQAKASVWLFVPPPPGHRDSVLCIGNSLTYTIFDVLQDAFTRGGSGLNFRRITTGGRKLNQHKDSLTNSEWSYQNTLSAKKWKYIVLQEAGYMPWRQSYKSRTFKKSLKAVLWWDKKIQELGAETVIYEPLGRRDGTYNMKSAKKKKLNFKAFAKATKKGVDNYIKALKKKGRKPLHAPVGTAFVHMHNHNQHLWRRLYDQDGVHPSPLGQYLASCVLFAAITGKSPTSLPIPSQASQYKYYGDWEKNVLRPSGIHDWEAKKIKMIAHKAVKR